MLGISDVFEAVQKLVSSVELAFLKHERLFWKHDTAYDVREQRCQPFEEHKRGKHAATVGTASNVVVGQRSDFGERELVSKAHEAHIVPTAGELVSVEESGTQDFMQDHRTNYGP